jgi:hypothetical protein
MGQVRVELHRIALGGSIRVKIDGGEPTYLTEAELRDRLAKIPTPAEKIEEIVASLSAGRGEHRLSFDNPSPDMTSFLARNFTGAKKPVER